MLPFTYGGDIHDFIVGEYVFIPGIRNAVVEGKREVQAYIISANGAKKEITLNLPPLTNDEKEIITMLFEYGECFAALLVFAFLCLT